MTDNNSNIDEHLIFDTALLLNRYKNIVKQKLLLFIEENKNKDKNEEKIKINFGDSLFNFLNKNCIKDMEHMKKIQHNSKTVDFMGALKILYLNKITVVTEYPSKLMQIIKDNLDKFICLTVLEEYYGIIMGHEYLIKSDTILIKITQKNKNIIIPFIQILDNNNVALNDINYCTLFYDQEQLKYIKNFVNGKINSDGDNDNDNDNNIYLLERLNIVFDYVLNNSEIINFDFFIFDSDQEIENNDLLNIYHEIYIGLVKYFNQIFIFPEKEFKRRIIEFLMRLQINHKKIADNKNKEMIETRLETNQEFNDYYNFFRDIDLNNNSVIYVYSTNSIKRNKINDALYRITKIAQPQNDNKNYKEYNNYIRDVAYNFSSKYNKQLFYNNNLICFAYFELSSNLYLKDIIYIRPGYILTLVTNTFTFTNPHNCCTFKSNITNHLIQVKLSWYNIFLLLQIHNETNIIIPYGTQLQIESMTPLNSLGNYYFKTKCINTLIDNKNVNINDFIRINRKLKMK